jgi:hypothetical protein
MNVLRIRWDSDDPSKTLDWRAATAILATLFLNLYFNFYTSDRLWMFLPLPLYVVLLAAVALLMLAAFFLGPALAAHCRAGSIFRAVEDSLGTLPALAVRLGGLVFLVLGTAAVLSLTTGFLARTWHLSPALLAGTIATFVFVTAQQSIRTEAGLAAFTNKLFLAIVVAALIRVHDGWPAMLGSFRNLGEWS